MQLSAINPTSAVITITNFKGHQFNYNNILIKYTSLSTITAVTIATHNKISLIKGNKILRVKWCADFIDVSLD